MVVKRIMIIIILFLFINMQGKQCIEKGEKELKWNHLIYTIWESSKSKIYKVYNRYYAPNIIVIIENMTGSSQIIQFDNEDYLCNSFASSYTLLPGKKIVIHGLYSIIDSFFVTGYGCYNLEKIYPYLGQPDKKGLVRCTISTEFTCMAE
ncbi:MAG: hypothetical protein KatS3mg129_1393 [Leptospiraceae bacterium]|nr:MAG: hypothetical protein KatS3mg129_1393 [Leptospiraceae bacterium]